MDIIIWIVTGLLFLIGTIGTIVPGLPGIALVFAGVLLFAATNGFELISIPFVLVAALLSAIAIAADYAGSVLGARAGGGKWKAMVGTVVGVAAGGIFFGPLGIVGGALLGGFLGALIEGATSGRALRVASVALVGVLGSAIVQLFLAISIVFAFLVALFF